MTAPDWRARYVPQYWDDYVWLRSKGRDAKGRLLPPDEVKGHGFLTKNPRAIIAQNGERARSRIQLQMWGKIHKGNPLVKAWPRPYEDTIRIHKTVYRILAVQTLAVKDPSQVGYEVFLR